MISLEDNAKLAIHILAGNFSTLVERPLKQLSLYVSHSIMEDSQTVRLFGSLWTVSLSLCRRGGSWVNGRRGGRELTCCHVNGCHIVCKQSQHCCPLCQHLWTVSCPVT